MKFISKAAIKSYWHAYLAVVAGYAIPYTKALLSSAHPHFNFYYFAWGLLGALVAPITRAAVTKYPWLSPLALRVTTKIRQEQGLSTPTPVAVVPEPVGSVEQPVVPA
jgi:hypothetical protein